MYRRHQTLDDAGPVMNDFGEGHEAVGRARGIGDDVDVRGIFFFIDAEYKDGCVGRRRRDCKV